MSHQEQGKREANGENEGSEREEECLAVRDFLFVWMNNEDVTINSNHYNGEGRKEDAGGLNGANKLAED